MNTDNRQPGLLDHEYDGIREFDNPTPGWWHLIFLGSVVFSVFYFVVFHMSPRGWTIWEAHDNAVARADAAAFEQLGELTSEPDMLLSLSANSVALAKGRAIFVSKCALCHGPAGGGMPALGPNLTDDHGKNIVAPEDVYRVASQGVAGTGMAAMEPQIGRADTILAAAYVISLRGTHVEGGRPPEGDPLPEWARPESD